MPTQLIDISLGLPQLGFNWTLPVGYRLQSEWLKSTVSSRLLWLKGC